MVKFTATKKESALIKVIATRACRLLKNEKGTLDTIMDIEAVHCNGNKLRLDDFAAAKDFDLLHDVTGINRHLDRKSGKLQHCFVPRFCIQ